MFVFTLNLCRKHRLSEPSANRRHSERKNCSKHIYVVVCIVWWCDMNAFKNQIIIPTVRISALALSLYATIDYDYTKPSMYSDAYAHCTLSSEHEQIVEMRFNFQKTNHELKASLSPAADQIVYCSIASIHFLVGVFEHKAKSQRQWWVDGSVM